MCRGACAIVRAGWGLVAAPGVREGFLPSDVMGRAVMLEPKTYPMSDVTKEFVGTFVDIFSYTKIFTSVNQCFRTVFWWTLGEALAAKSISDIRKTNELG